jgi:hypothetical protein
MVREQGPVIRKVLKVRKHTGLNLYTEQNELNIACLL